MANPQNPYPTRQLLGVRWHSRSYFNVSFINAFATSGLVNAIITI